MSLFLTTKKLFKFGMLYRQVLKKENIFNDCGKGGML